MNILHEACASIEDLGDLQNMEVRAINKITDSDGNEGVMFDFVGNQGEKVSISIMDGAEIHRTPAQYPVYCGQDLREYVGYTIKNVEGDDNDLDCRVTIENEAGHKAVLIMGGLSMDGESLFIEKDEEI